VAGVFLRLYGYRLCGVLRSFQMLLCRSSYTAGLARSLEMFILSMG